MLAFILLNWTRLYVSSEVLLKLDLNDFINLEFLIVKSNEFQIRGP